MGIPIIQTLVGLTLVLLGVALTGKPPTTKNERWLYRGIFAVLGVLLLSLSWMQYKSEQRKMADAGTITPAPNASQTALQQPSQKENALIQSNQLDLQKKYQEILNELASNSSLDPSLRERIIIANAQLGKIGTRVFETKTLDENLKGGLDHAAAPKPVPNRQDLGEAQSSKDKILPYFDYAIKTLAALSEKEGALKKDKSVLLYENLPQDVSPEAKGGKRPRINAADIKFLTNADWDFKIEFVEEMTPQYEANLGVTCQGGFLLLKTTGDAIETRFESFKGESFEHGLASGDAAKANIADALGKMVAAEADAVEAKK